MKQETFVCSIEYLQRLYGHKLQDEAVKAYWERLALLDEKDFLWTLQNIVDTFIPTANCPFPVPAHFTRTQTRDIVSQIWMAARKAGAYRSVCFNDTALHETIRIFGGWPLIARAGDEWWDFNRKRFEEVYEQSKLHNSNMTHVPGQAEIENNKDGLNCYQLVTIGRDGKELERITIKEPLKLPGIKKEITEKSNPDEIVGFLANKMSV